MFGKLPPPACPGLCYVKFVCVKFVCEVIVCVRRREEKEEKEPGIQNQKQEPHTKMWGINRFNYELVEPIVFPVRSDSFPS